jgi:dephospho-CoA kinase
VISQRFAFDTDGSFGEGGCMKLVGLTGGIGAGKSTVSLLLTEFGAGIVDADLIARAVVAPGSAGLAAISARFGTEVLLPDGALNRPVLASIVFGDSEALAALNGITHPAIAVEVTSQTNAHRGTDRVVVYDAALLIGKGPAGMVGRILVDVDPEVAVGRLQAFRGFSEADARSRIAAQVDRATRLSAADFVVDNSGDVEALRREVDRVWAWIATLPPSPELA